MITPADLLKVAATRNSHKLEAALVGVDTEAFLRALPDSAFGETLWYDVRDDWACGVPGYEDETLVGKFAEAIDTEAERRSYARRNRL